MKFDTIIIGGGLAGLICGIRLQKSGKRCAIISSGQSALHFSSGSFDLLGNTYEGEEVNAPLDNIKNLKDDHPYRLVGVDNIRKYADEMPEFFNECGISAIGNSSKNHYRITPTGAVKNTWLTLSDFQTFEELDKMPWSKALIVNFDGFLDFYPQFISDFFEAKNVRTNIKSISVSDLDRMRVNSTEMRSSNIASVFESEQQLDKLIEQLNIISAGHDVIVMPAVFGLSSSAPVEYLKKHVVKPICLIPTALPSVPGIRSQQSLIKYFTRLGGVHMLGDSVLAENVINEDGRIESVKTVNQGRVRFKANDYVLATGSFFNKGIVAGPESVYESLFDLDVNYDIDRSKWFTNNFFQAQPYMAFGVKTDKDFHPMKDGKIIKNLYAIGSVLSGSNSLLEGCGAGVSMFTALSVADKIINKPE